MTSGIKKIRAGLTTVKSGIYRASMGGSSFVCLIFSGFYVCIDFERHFRKQNPTSHIENKQQMREIEFDVQQSINPLLGGVDGWIRCSFGGRKLFSIAASWDMPPSDQDVEKILDKYRARLAECKTYDEALAAIRSWTWRPMQQMREKNPTPQ